MIPGEWDERPISCKNPCELSIAENNSLSDDGARTLLQLLT